MRRQSACRHRQPQQEPPPPPPPPPPAASSQGGCDTCCHPSRRQQRCSSGGRRGLLLFLLLASWVSSCQGAPVVSHVLQGEQDLHLWNEIDDACSVYLARDTQPQSSSSALEELCFMLLGLLQKMQVFDKKESTKRFLFHYSKTHDTGNSNSLSSVLHPLLQLVPHLHEERLKRYKMDEELQIPGGIQSRGYFVFRPRNGRRSATSR